MSRKLMMNKNNTPSNKIYYLQEYEFDGDITLENKSDANILNENKLIGIKEILGNTLQDNDNLNNIQHLGELQINEDGESILDSEGREQYKIEVESRNKNLFNLEAVANELGFEYEDSSLIVDKGGFGNKLTINFIGVKNKTKYAVSATSYTPITLNGTWSPVIGAEYYDGTVVEKYTFNGLNFVTDINKDVKYFYLRNPWSRVTGKINNIQIEEKAVTDYVPHQSQKQMLLLPCQLMKVGDVADRLYLNNDKRKWILEKNISRKIYKDITGWEVLQHSDNLLRFFMKLDDAIEGDSIDVISNKVPSIGYDITKKNIFISGGGIYLILNESDLVDRNLSEWLEKEPLEVYHPVKTPLITNNVADVVEVETYKDRTHLSVKGGIDARCKCLVPFVETVE